MYCMSHQETMEPITGTVSKPDEQLIVQKSLPLLSLWRSPMSLAEFKILDTYLSRIDSHNPSRRWVRLEKGELESILGIQRIKIDVLKKRLANLCIVVEIEDPTIPDGFRAISLFEQMVCEPDENGLWQVDLQCTQAAMQYIFNVDTIGYLRYRLRAVLHLRSRYSYILFMYIEQNRFRGTWQVSVQELRHILNCDQDVSYQEFKRFNDRILKKAQKEILEKVSYYFTYKPIRKGRKISEIQFSVAHSIEAENSITSRPQTSSERNSKHTKNDMIELLCSACTTENGHAEFSENEMRQIIEILRVIPPSKLPEYTPMGNDWIFQLYHYLAEKYASMNSKRNIKNRFAYLVKILKADAGLS